MSLLHVNDRRATYPPTVYAARLADLPPPRPGPGGDRGCDVAIVGGGYTGLSAAWHCAQAGLSVRLFEAHRVGFGASGRNGGQVAVAPRLDQRMLEARFGAATARALWELARSAHAVTRDVASDDPDCDWHPGIAYLNRSPAGVAAAHRHAEHLHRVYDHDTLRPLDRAAARALVRSDAHAGGLLEEAAGQVDPLALALRLARLAEGAGAILHEDSEVTALDPGPILRVGGHQIRAGQVILAGNGYLQGVSRAVAARVFAINNYVVATDPLPEGAVFARRLAATDDRFVVNYWRTTADNRLIFGGGESYGDRFPADIAAEVRGRLARIFPHLADTPIAHAWGGTLAITRSRLPYLGQPGPGLWAAGGYSGHGVAMAILAGRVLAQAIREDTASFDTLAATAPGPFPGGALARKPVMRLAMAFFALRDRLGL